MSRAQVCSVGTKNFKTAARERATGRETGDRRKRSSDSRGLVHEEFVPAGQTRSRVHHRDVLETLRRVQTSRERGFSISTRFFTCSKERSQCYRMVLVVLAWSVTMWLFSIPFGQTSGKRYAFSINWRRPRGRDEGAVGHPTWSVPVLQRCNDKSPEMLCRCPSVLPTSKASMSLLNDF